MYLGFLLKKILAGESCRCPSLKDLTHVEGCIRLWAWELYLGSKWAASDGFVTFLQNIA